MPRLPVRRIARWCLVKRFLLLQEPIVEGRTSRSRIAATGSASAPMSRTPTPEPKPKKRPKDAEPRHSGPTHNLRQCRATPAFPALEERMTKRIACRTDKATLQTMTVRNRGLWFGTLTLRDANGFWPTHAVASGLWSCSTADVVFSRLLKIPEAPGIYGFFQRRFADFLEA